MKGDHGHHKHHPYKEQAEKRVGKIEEHLEEKTLHGHSEAMHSDTRNQG